MWQAFIDTFEKWEPTLLYSVFALLAAWLQLRRRRLQQEREAISGKPPPLVPSSSPPPP